MEININAIKEQWENIPYCQPDGNPKPEWALFIHQDLVQARYAAIVASIRNGRTVKYRKHYNTTLDAVIATVKNLDSGKECLDLLRKECFTIAWDCAKSEGHLREDITLYAYMQIVSDLGIEQKYRDHVAARMEVWQKGYCLMADVDGVLYVYAKE